MSEPLISIIIPVFNGEQYLDRCFSTLEAQTYPNLEIIFINNGSTDNSKEVMERYCINKGNVKVLECSKKGPSAARNVGIKFAMGKYISFLDVDDEINPDKHQLLMDTFISNPTAGIVVGNTFKQYSDGRQVKINLGPLKNGLNLPPSPGMQWLQQFQHQPHISAILVPKRVIEKVGYFSEDLLFGEDISLTVKIGLEFPVICINDTLSTYNRHPDSAVSIANQHISTTERYFQFHAKFALPYFYEKHTHGAF